ncbi:UDP-N-acetylmuramyl-tripeptide synthetase [Candidatus Uhrbacteria bacterium]|nr:UDP-N-acetylmuramyl-tripeptide synthetase [Candidatus Uhrbacteria bacterium]
MLSFLKSLLGNRNPIRLLWHHAKAFAAGLRYGFPARKLTVIGITGTDGKTTTVMMTAHILDKAGIAAGAVSTSFFSIRGMIEENPTHKTSMSPFILQSFLRRCVKEGCTHAVVEISSHGLVQHRNDFLRPAVAAITNTSPEHLDYHKTMEQYRKDKGTLFSMLQGKGTKVLNADDETFTLYKEILSKRTIVYSPLRDLKNIETTTLSTNAIVSVDGVSVAVKLPIPGTFNLYNALCALSCAAAVGIAPQKSADALATFTGVPGRMERIDEGQPFSVYVDFTVSPAAYEKTLDAIRATLAEGKRLLVLTGSCGDRMPEKRPMIGAIVSDRADVVVVSEDETLTEDQNKVIDEVWTGIDQGKIEAHKIFDRREGILFLLKEARPGDAVALCGMGACTTMQTREGLRPWDEREVAQEILRDIQKK